MNTSKSYRRIFWASLLLVLTAFTIGAQEFRGSLSGKILDPQGAVVPASKFDLKNVETGVVVSTTTDEDGSSTAHR